VYSGSASFTSSTSIVFGEVVAKPTTSPAIRTTPSATGSAGSYIDELFGLQANSLSPRAVDALFASHE
jgi:hypothetical protein